MKRLSFILLLCAIVSVASAQKITHTFQDNPLSEALKYIQEQATDYNITFIYDELEDFRLIYKTSQFPKLSCRLLASIPFVWSRVENMRFMWNVPTRPTAI